MALQNVQALETLFALLPFRVGSPLSLNALAEDLQVAYNTVKVWVEVMEVQSQLNVPAIQLVDTGEAYRRTGAGRQPLLIAPAARWLATLP